MITDVSGKIDTKNCIVRITEMNSLQLNLVNTPIGSRECQSSYQLRQMICAEDVSKHCSDLAILRRLMEQVVHMSQPSSTIVGRPAEHRLVGCANNYLVG